MAEFDQIEDALDHMPRSLSKRFKPGISKTMAQFWHRYA
jgi:hypothetical protein